MTSRECITIHVGQAGVQLGAHLWELYCLEHGVIPTGIMPFCPLPEDVRFSHSMFQEHEGGTYIPRALFIDMESQCINNVRNGRYRHLFHPDHFIVGKEDTANNFARGYYTMAREFHGITFERIRQMVEKCDGLQGFNVFRSIGGGCGGGFGSFLFDKLNVFYGRKAKISYDIIPSPQIRSEVVEPYNAVFANHAGDGKVDVSFNFDNESFADICSRRLGIKNAHFHNYNSVLAQVISGMTSTLRFSGTSLAEFQTNLVPFPRVRFPIVSYAPAITQGRSRYEEFAMPTMIANVLDTRNALVRCNTRIGKYMSMSLNFRGNVSPHEISMAKYFFQTNPKSPAKIRFVDFTPPGFKVNICDRLPFLNPGTEFGPAPRTVIAMMNSTAIAQPWEGLRRKFELMWKKRAFMHWYLAEGMEEVEFEDAHENMNALRADYADLERDGKCQQGSLDLSVRGTSLNYSSSQFNGARSYGMLPAITKNRSTSRRRSSSTSQNENEQSAPKRQRARTQPPPNAPKIEVEDYEAGCNFE